MAMAPDGHSPVSTSKEGGFIVWGARMWKFWVPSIIKRDLSFWNARTWRNRRRSSLANPQLPYFKGVKLLLCPSKSAVFLSGFGKSGRWLTSTRFSCEVWMLGRGGEFAIPRTR